MSTAPNLGVVRHATVLECMAAYLECDWDEVADQEGVWRWADEDGVQTELSMQEALEYILNERHTWGWIENKNRIHIWFDGQATPAEVLAALAHEIGHARRPFHRCEFREEEKASKYGAVAVTAFEIMTELMEADDAKA